MKVFHLFNQRQLSLRILLMSFLVLFSFLHTLLSQGITTNAFEYIRIVRGADFPARNIITFSDSVTQKNIKSINLTEVNPYKVMPGHRSGVDKAYGTPVYHIKPEQLRENKFLDQIKDSMFFKGKDTISFNLMSYYKTTLNSQYFIAVLFNMLLSCKNKVILSRSSIYIYNQRGDLIDSVMNNDHDAFFPFISDDGRFLCFNTGNDFGEGFASDISPGFMIYDIMNKKKLTHETGMQFNIGVIDNIYFIVSNKDLKNKGIYYRIYDPYNNLVYSKLIDFDTNRKLKYYDKNGFFFQDKENNNSFKYIYKNDFNANKIYLR